MSEEIEEKGEETGISGFQPSFEIFRELIYETEDVNDDDIHSLLKPFVDKIIARGIITEKDVDYIDYTNEIIEILTLMGAGLAYKFEVGKLRSRIIARSAVDGKLVKLGVAPQLLSQSQKKRRRLI